MNDNFSKFLNKELQSSKKKDKNINNSGYETYNTKNNNVEKIGKKYSSYIGTPLAPDINKELRDIGIVPSILDKPEDYQYQIDEYVKEQKRLAEEEQQRKIAEEKAEQRRKAENQSAWEKWGNWVVQVVGGEIVLGVVKGCSDLVEMGYHLVTDQNLGDFSNPVSGFLEKGQDYIRKEFPIYSRNPDESWDVGDLGWWLNGSTSIASTVTLLIPGTAVGKAASYVGKLGRGVATATKYTKPAQAVTSKGAQIASKITKGKIGSTTSNTAKNIADVSKIANSSKLAKVGNTAKQNFLIGFNSQSRAARFMDTGITIGAGALASRSAENYMEAREVYRDIYKTALNDLDNPEYAENIKKLKEENPEFENMTNEQIADELAHRSGIRTFKQNYAWLVFDLLQFRALNKILNGGVKNINKISTVNTRLANRNVARKLAGKNLEKMNFWQKSFDALKHPSYKTLSALSEVPEEMFQGITTEQGKEVYKSTMFPDYQERSVISYLSDPKIWEQGFWGFIGGKTANTVVSGYKNLKDRYRVKHNPDAFDDKYNEYILSSEEKIALQKIEAREEHFEKMHSEIEAIEKELNDNKIDENTYNDKKQKAIKTFLADITLDAMDSGTYDLLKEFMINPEFKEALNNNIDFTNDYENYLKEIIKETDKIKDIYADEVHKTLQNVYAINPYAARITGRYLTRQRLELEDLNDKILNIDNAISQSSINDPNSSTTYAINLAYYNKAYNDSLIKRSDEIKKTINKLKEQQYTPNDEDFNISKQAKYEKIKELERELELLNQELNTIGNFPLNVSKPLPLVVDLLNNKINAKTEYLKLQSRLPITSEDYTNTYQYFSEILDKETKTRFKNSYDKVFEWFKKQKDLDKAYEDILNDNVEELHDDLDILKLGYGNGALYQTQLELNKSILELERKTKNNGNISEINDIEQIEELEKGEQEISDNENNIKLNAKITSNINKAQSKLNKFNKIKKEEVITKLSEINKIIKDVENDIAAGYVMDEEQENKFKKLKNDFNEIKENYKDVQIEEVKIDENVTFTGEELKSDETPLDNRIYENPLETTEEEQISNFVNEVLEKENEELQNNELLVFGDTYKYILEFFKEHKDLFKAIETIDAESEEFNNLFNELKNYIINKNVYGLNIDEVIKSDLKTFIVGLKNRINKGGSIHEDIINQLDNILKIISSGVKTKYDNTSASNTEFIDTLTDEDVIKLLMEVNH